MANHEESTGHILAEMALAKKKSHRCCDHTFALLEPQLNALLNRALITSTTQGSF